MPGAVEGQGLGDGAALGGVRHAHRQMLHLGPPVAQGLPQVVFQRRQLPGAGDHFLPLPGHHQLAPGALEDMHTQFLLQRLDVLAHRRLGDVQALGRLGIVQRLRHRQQREYFGIQHGPAAFP